MRIVKAHYEMVYPATPSPGGTLELTLADRTMHGFYLPIALFFQEGPPPDAFLLLKASLAEVLALFYPFAGRFRECSDVVGNGDLVFLACNDEGALLHEVWVDVSYDHFAPDFDFHPDLPLVAPPTATHVADIWKAPILLAQITHFQCGRICLCISTHHSLCDGFSVAQVLSCWAELTLSLQAKERRPDHHLRPKEDLFHLPYEHPVIDPSLLKPNPRQPSAAISANHPEYVTHLATDTQFFFPAVSKMFAFTPSEINGIRAKASRAPGGGATAAAPQYTRFEALTGYLWRGITLARGLKPEQSLTMIASVNCRGRLRPPLPKGYFGNVVFYARAAATAGEITGKPIEFAAGLVKDATGKVSDEHVRSAMGWIAEQIDCGRLVRPANMTSCGFCITSWERFPYRNLNFGWGKASWVRVPVSTLLEGLVLLIPSPRGEGHVDVAVGLREDHMTNFEQYVKDTLQSMNNDA